MPLSFSYADLKNMWSDFRGTNLRSKLIIIGGCVLFVAFVFCSYQFYGSFSQQTHVVIDRSQEMTNSPGSVMVQGDGNTVTITQPLAELTYKPVIFNALEADKKFHSEFIIKVANPSSSSAVIATLPFLANHCFFNLTDTGIDFPSGKPYKKFAGSCITAEPIEDNRKLFWL